MNRQDLLEIVKEAKAKWQEGGISVLDALETAMTPKDRYYSYKSLKAEGYWYQDKNGVVTWVNKHGVYPNSPTSDYSNKHPDVIEIDEDTAAMLVGRNPFGVGSYVWYHDVAGKLYQINPDGMGRIQRTKDSGITICALKDMTPVVERWFVADDSPNCYWHIKPNGLFERVENEQSCSTAFDLRKPTSELREVREDEAVPRGRNGVRVALELLKGLDHPNVVIQDAMKELERTLS